MKYSVTLKIAIFTSIFLLGGVLGYYIRVRYALTLPVNLVQVRQKISEYPLISPLLYVDNIRKSPEFNSLSLIVENYINKIASDGVADSVSMYFRDLNTGRWTGVNEDVQYKPSSMLKVLVMMVYMAKSEKDPSILNKDLL